MRAIITFHSIDDSPCTLSYPVKSLEYLLQTLFKKNIPILTLDTLLDEKTTCGVSLTFDDGMQSVYSNALKVLKQYQAPAHLFLATDLPNKKCWPEPQIGVGHYKMLNWIEIDELLKHGMLLESHTHTHPDITELTINMLHQECQQADEIIKKKSGRQPKYFAYPKGRHNNASRKYIRDRYPYAVTTELDYLNQFAATEAIPRIDSYYLNDRLIDNLDQFFGRYYIRFRSHIRNLRGSQTRANAN